MFGDVRENFEIELASELGGQLVAEPEQLGPHERVELLHPLAEIRDLEHLEIDRRET